MKMFCLLVKNVIIQGTLIILLVALCVSLTGCKKWLNEKTDKKLVVPATTTDAWALLDFYSLMNGFYPSIGIQSDDDTYLSEDYWNTLTVTDRNNYVWEKENFNDEDWGNMYQVVLNANLALETINKIEPAQTGSNDWKNVKGAALFYRAYAFYQVAEYYADPYNKSTAESKPGIPLRLTSDITEVSKRSSLSQTYAQIINDFKEASQLLPLQTPVLSRPSKAAALGALARTYLAMQEYSLAKNYSDSCLLLENTLIDYNTLDSSALYPVPQFNAEVIFPSVMLTPSRFDLGTCTVDTLLYLSYEENDLRRSVFFTPADERNFSFRGSYDGSRSLFNGIAVDEIYLISAECKARLGLKEEALIDLNTMLVKRWLAGSFIPLTAVDAAEALTRILLERRKEIILRGSRWFDLRRLNTEMQTGQTLIRILGGNIYSLPPGDPRYTQYIPNDVIALTGMQQNVRQR